MKKILVALALLVLLLAGLPGWSASQEQGASTSAAAQPTSRSARVAGGTVVELAPSGRSNSEWAEARPNYRALIPQKR